MVYFSFAALFVTLTASASLILVARIVLDQILFVFWPKHSTIEDMAFLKTSSYGILFPLTTELLSQIGYACKKRMEKIVKVYRKNNNKNKNNNDIHEDKTKKSKHESKSTEIATTNTTEQVTSAINKHKSAFFHRNREYLTRRHHYDPKVNKNKSLYIDYYQMGPEYHKRQSQMKTITTGTFIDPKLPGDSLTKVKPNASSLSSSAILDDNLSECNFVMD